MHRLETRKIGNIYYIHIYLSLFLNLSAQYHHIKHMKYKRSFLKISLMHSQESPQNLENPGKADEWKAILEK